MKQYGNNIMEKRFLTQVYFFLVVLLFISSFVNQISAQDLRKYATKGVLELGGNISYQYMSIIANGNEEYSYNVFSFFPYVGYFICDNLEIGVNPLGVQTNWNSQEHTTLLSIFISPAYVFDINEKIFPFVEAQYGYTLQSAAYEISELNASGQGFSWGGRAGIKYLLAKSCLLNLGLQYRQISITPRGESTRSGSNSLMLSAGFTFYME
jgi:hypothetical protein